MSTWLFTGKNAFLIPLLIATTISGTVCCTFSTKYGGLDQLWNQKFDLTHFFPLCLGPPLIVGSVNIDCLFKTAELIYCILKTSAAIFVGSKSDLRSNIIRVLNLMRDALTSSNHSNNKKTSVKSTIDLPSTFCYKTVHRQSVSGCRGQITCKINS